MVNCDGQDVMLFTQDEKNGKLLWTRCDAIHTHNRQTQGEKNGKL